MAQTNKKLPTPTKGEGVPTFFVVNVLFSAVLLSIEYLKGTVAIGEADRFIGPIFLGYTLLGLATCFLWRRLATSMVQSSCTVIYLASYWLYALASIIIPILPAQLSTHLISSISVHQIGLLGLIASAAALILGISSKQKGPSAALTIICGMSLVGLSLYSMTKPSDHSLSHELSDEQGEELIMRNSSKTSEASDHRSGDHESEETELKAADSTHQGKPSVQKAKKMSLSALKNRENTDSHHQQQDESHSAPKSHKEHEDAEESETQNPKKPTFRVKSAKSTEHAHSQKQHKQAHWAYSGDTGPRAWGKLSSGFGICESGLEQSPIHLAAGWPVSESIGLEYKDSQFEVLDNGHTIQVNVERGNFAVIRNQKFELKQFHFHSPSEHRVAAQQSMMEVHFVHANSDGKLAVIGALIKLGAEHLHYKNVWDLIPEKTSVAIKPYNSTLDLRRLLPKNLAAFQYSGSLTTPPCSEGVQWNVLKETITLSSQQIEKFRNKYANNARPIQPLNYRKAPVSSNRLAAPRVAASAAAVPIINTSAP